MSAKPVAGLWGRGVWSAPSEGVGGIAVPVSGLSDDLWARIEGSDAKEAIESLDLPNGADKLNIQAAVFPGPVSEAFYWSNADVLGINGPVGSGKTTTLMKRLLRRAIEMPQSVIDGVRYYTVTITRETYRQLWATTIPSYLETFPRAMGEWSGGRGDPVRHVIRFEDEFGPIVFVAQFLAYGDNIVESMRGLQTTDMVLNEADTMQVDVLTVGIGRIDRSPAREHFAGLPESLRSYGSICCDLNAPDEDNWTYRVFWDEEERLRTAKELSSSLPEGAKAVEVAFFRQPGYSEPGTENLQNLSASYYPRQIATMKLAGRGDMIDRLVYNKIVTLKAGDPVWKREFNRRVHVADVRPGEMPLIPGVPLRIGFDQGFKGAAVIAQFLTPMRWRIYAELHFPQERLMAAVFGQRLAELLSTPRFADHQVEGGWGDMAGEQGASHAADENDSWNRLVSRACGFPIRPQKIGTNRLQPRLEAVRAPLEYMDAGEPGILIDPGCRFMVRGFEARYVWTDEIDASGDKRKIPDKRFTEANVHDALQYLLLSAHSGNGNSPFSFPALSRAIAHQQRLALTGGPPWAGSQTGGLRTGYDLLNPYGD